MARKGQGYGELETCPALASLEQGLIAPGAYVSSWALDKVRGALGGLVRDITAWCMSM